MQTSSTTTEIDHLAQKLGIDHESLKRAKARYKGDERTLLRRLKRQLAHKQAQIEREDQAEWERQQTNKAIERHEATRQSTIAALRKHREQQTPWQRLHAAAHKLQLLTSPGAASLQRSTGHGKPDSKAPPKIAEAIDNDYYLRLVEDAVEQLERQLDAADGLVIPPNQLTGEEKDREIVQRWQGYHSTHVTTLAPHLGSRATVEKARVRLGWKPTFGDQLREAA